MAKDKEVPKEILECRKQVAKVLDRPNLFVTPKLLEHPFRRFFFSSEDSSLAETGDRVYSVVPFHDTGGMKYWVGIYIDVMLGRSISLYAVSLVVFEGEASDRLKTPAFRAEWDYTDSSKNQPHAQPHWHIYSIIDKSVEDTGGTFEPEPQVKPFKAKGTDEIKRFHFALGSQWHLNRNSHTCQLDFSNISTWLDGCINYVRGQFDYLYSS